MPKLLKRSLLILGFLILGGAAFMVVQIGPRNVIGLLRYDQRQEGRLQVGDRAPDVTVTALDGSQRPLLPAGGAGGATGASAKPTVLIFGSYT